MRAALASVLQVTANTARSAGLSPTSHEAYADAVIAAGWRPPPAVITDPAELDDLPEGAVIVDALHAPRQLIGGRWAAPDVQALSAHQVPLPAVALDVAP